MSRSCGGGALQLRPSAGVPPYQNTLMLPYDPGLCRGHYVELGAQVEFYSAHKRGRMPWREPACTRMQTYEDTSPSHWA
eukprot:scaffold1518_cov417-Prasinococcus_capsulatus_cf.AAC.31